MPSTGGGAGSLGSVGEASVRIVADGAGFNESASRIVHGVAGSLGRVLGPALGVASIAGFVATGIHYAEQIQVISAQTATVIKSTAGAAGVSQATVEGLARSLGDVSGQGRIAVQTAENLLLTFSNIKGDTFKRTTADVLDMAQALHTDASSAASVLGKALNDPVKGMARLQRAGVTLTDSQKDTVKQLVATGQTAKAQGILLDAVEKKFGGSAAAFGNTFAGQKERLKEAFKELAGQVGSLLLPILSKLASFGIEVLVPALSKLFDLIGREGAVAFAALATAWESVVRGFQTGQISGSGITRFLTQVGVIARDVVAWVVAHWPQIRDTIVATMQAVGRAIATAFDYIVHNKAILLGILVAIAAGLAAWAVSAAAAAIATAAAALPFIAVGVAIAGIVAILVASYRHWAAFRDIVNSIAAWARRNWPQIRTIIVTVLVDVVKALTVAVLWVRRNWPTFQAVIVTVVKAVTVAVTTFIGWVRTAWPVISAIAVAVFGAVVKAVSAFVDFVTTKVIPATKAVWNEISHQLGLFGAYWAERWDDISKVIDRVLTALKLVALPAILVLVGAFKLGLALIGPIMTVLRVTVETTLKVIAALWDRYGSIILAALRLVWDNIKLIIVTAMNVIKGIIDIVLGLLSGDWGRAWSGMEQVLSALWGLMTGLVQLGIRAMLLIIQTVLATIAAIWSAAWNGMKAALVAIWGGIIAFIDAIPGAIAKALSGLGNLLYSVGTDLMSGLFRGVVNGWSMVYNFLIDLPGRVAGAFGDAAKILFSWGANLVSGLVAGIKSQAGAIISAIAGLIPGGGIAATVWHGILGFASGGIVNAAPGDAVPAIVHGGEMVLNASQQARMWQLLSRPTTTPSTPASSGGGTPFHVSVTTSAPVALTEERLAQVLAPAFVLAGGLRIGRAA